MKGIRPMKTKIFALTAISLATFVFYSTQAHAENSTATSSSHSEDHQESGDGKGGPRSDKFERRGKEMFEKTDSDKDGFLSKEEMEASHRARMEEMFNKTDMDKDGKLSPEELQKGRESMRDRFRQKYREGRNQSEIKPDDRSEDKSTE